jgi:hypothetical protein
MITATVRLKGVSPYGQSRNYVMDVPKNDKERPDDYEKRTWRNRLHIMKDGPNAGHVFIPPMAFKNCLAEAAKYLSMQVPGKGKATYTKYFEAGTLVDPEPIVLPDIAENVESIWLYVPSDGKRGGSKRVWKCFPIINNWEVDVVFHILEESITEEIFLKHIQEAGRFIGIGFFRPRNNGYYGRFSVEKLTWVKQD